MKVGLISDTHLSSGRLPQAVLNTFWGVDAILHAGDLVTMNIVRQLESVAPVTAVQGNMDMPGVRRNLTLKTVYMAEGHHIGLIHGHRVPSPNQVLSSPMDFDAMHNYLLSEFEIEGLDCIVYGHTHVARVEMHEDVLFVNPGSATRGKDGHATVGMLHLSQDQIRGEIIRIS